MTDRGFNRGRAGADSEDGAAFAGVEHRRATAAQMESAHRSTRRHHRDRRLAAKLDELLGSVNEEEGL